MIERDLSHYFLGRLSQLLGGPDLLVYLRELEQHRDPVVDTERAVAGEPFFRRKKWDTIYDLGPYRITNYVLIRALQPKLMIETGVLHGSQTLGRLSVRDHSEVA